MGSASDTAGGSSEPPAPVPAPRPDPRGFRRELTPTWLATATLLAGQRPPDLARPFRAVYLGLGTGETAAVVAAVHPAAQVFAWDPRPGPVEATRVLRDRLGLANLSVHERPSLPGDLAGVLGGHADLVVVAGLLDALDDEGREHVVGAIATGLRPGGLACVTYKTVIGWVEIAPVVRLMRYVARRGGRYPASMVTEVLDLLARLRAGGAMHLTQRPVVAAWLDDLATLDDATIAREYLTCELRPISHAQVVDLLAPTGCAYVGSAHLTDDLDGDLPPALVDMIRTAPTPVLRETYRDLALRRTRRADVFRLGAAPLRASEHAEALADLELAGLVASPDDLPRTVKATARKRLATGTLPAADLDRSAARATEAVRTLMDAGLAHPVAPGGAATEAVPIEVHGHLRTAPSLGSALPVGAPHAVAPEPAGAR